MIKGQPPTPQVVFSENASDRNFDIAICSTVFQRPYYKTFGVDRIRHSLGVRVVSYIPVAYKVFMKGVVV